MPNPEKMIAAIHNYVAGFEAGNPDMVTNLYAEDGTLEDPVGSGMLRGRAAIHAFYTESMTHGPKHTLERPISIAGEYAAISFTARLRAGGWVDIIETFKFDEEGKILEMRAFWGPTNLHGF